MVDIVAILHGSVANAHVYDYGSHVQLCFTPTDNPYLCSEQLCLKRPFNQYDLEFGLADVAKRLRD